MVDILPKDGALWRKVFEVGEKISELHNFHFIETPVVEPTALFEATLDIDSKNLDKEFYSFKTKRRENVVLRPNGIAPVLRSYLENKLGRFASPFRFYYRGAFYAYGRRISQDYRWGFGVIGESDPFYDADIILAIHDFLNALYIKDPVININAAGCRVCRSNYMQKLKSYYKHKRKNLCSDCSVHYEQSPLQMLSCEKDSCKEIKKEAPVMLNFLCQSCNNHFKDLLELIEDNEISYVPDLHLTHGTDYYSRMVFEIKRKDDESNKVLASGGRCDYLAERLGSRSIQATSSVIYLGDLIEELKRLEVDPMKNKKMLFFVAVGDKARKSSLRLMRKLRQAGVIVMESLGKKTLASQLKIAQKSNAPLAVIYGQKEAFEGEVILRDLVSGLQESVPLEKMVEEVKRRLR